MRASKVGARRFGLAHAFWGLFAQEITIRVRVAGIDLSRYTPILPGDPWPVVGNPVVPPVMPMVLPVPPPVVPVAPPIPKKKKRGAARYAFERSPAWRQLRELVLAAYGRTCRACGSQEQIQVDHIKPKSRFPELALDFDNMQVLCWPCNRRKAAHVCPTSYQSKDHP